MWKVDSEEYSNPVVGKGMMAGYFRENAVGFWGMWSIGILVGVIGCGGAQKSKTEMCLEARDAILNRTESDVCSPMTLDQFETEVNRWGKECFSPENKKDSDRVFKKLLVARECAEKKRQLEAKNKNCAHKLKKVEAEGLFCLGRDCDPFVEQLNAILKECSDPKLGGVYKKKAEDQLHRFEERATSGDRLKNLKDLMVLCDEQLNLASQENPKAALKRVLKKVKKNKEIKKTTEPDTEIDRFTKGALASCGLAIQTALATLTEAADLILSSTELKRSSPKWKSTYKQLKLLERPLKQIKAEELFPGSTDGLKEILEKYKK